MGYARAVEKAWEDLALASPALAWWVRFLADDYRIDARSRSIVSHPRRVPAKEYLSIIILHYLAVGAAMGGLPRPTGEWIDFNQLEGGEAYYSTFRKRTIDVILKKYGRAPEGILSAEGRLPASPVNRGDAGVIITPLVGVPILAALWRGDDEFDPDGAILYDASISAILCTEDVVVLTEIVAHAL